MNDPIRKRICQLRLETERLDDLLQRPDLDRTALPVARAAVAIDQAAAELQRHADVLHVLLTPAASAEANKRSDGAPR